MLGVVNISLQSPKQAVILGGNSSWGTLMKLQNIVFALCAGLLFASHCTAAYNIIAFTSSPNSWVGEGKSWSFSADNGFTINGGLVTSGIGTTNSVQFTPSKSGFNEDWELGLVGPNNSLLTIGTYNNAIRFPFQDHSAGFSLTGNGRGDNTLTATFTVLEATYNQSSLVSFAADFIQYDEGKADEWEQGSIRFNSSIPVPEPSTLILAAPGLFGLVFMVRRRLALGSRVIEISLQGLRTS